MKNKSAGSKLKIYTDKHGSIHGSEGDFTFFAGKEMEGGTLVTNYFHALEALIPPAITHLQLPNIEIRDGFYVNIEIRDMGKGLIIQLADNSQSVASYREELQRNNEERFFARENKTEQISYEQMLSESLYHLSAAIFEYIGKGRAQVSGKAPAWLKALHPEIRSGIPFTLTDVFPFLETILADFEALIRKDINGSIVSEVWAEEEAGGNEKLMQCIAIVKNCTPWLVIFTHETLLIRDREILQKAREQRLYTDELKKARKELQNLLNFKDQFISIITHDIRSPVSSVVSATDLMLSDEDFRKAIRDLYLEFLETINKDMKHLLDYNEKLYYWSNLQLGKFRVENKRISLFELIYDTRNRFFGKAGKKNIELKAIVKDDLFVLADESLFSQVLTNLVNNAIKFTPVGGEVFMQAKQDGKQVALSVRDTGIGIRQELQKNIFSGYVKDHADGTKGEKGSGLGLGIVKRILDAHGFEIELVSEPGKGTEFIIRIPIKD